MGIGIGIITAIKAVTGGQDKLGVYFYLSKEPAAAHLIDEGMPENSFSLFSIRKGGHPFPDTPLLSLPDVLSIRCRVPGCPYPPGPSPPSLPSCAACRPDTPLTGSS